MTYQYKECGLDNIYLVNGYDHIDTDYGPATTIHDVDGLHEAIAFSLCDTAKLKGAEFRFLRHYLNLSQTMVGQFFGMTDQAVAKWEKHNKVPKLADIMLRALCKERLLGNVELTKLMKDLSKLDRDIHERTVLIEETDTGWQQKAA